MREMAMSKEAEMGSMQSGDIGVAADGLPVKPLLAIEDVAAALEVSAKTVKRWIRAGDVPGPAVIGTKKRWPRAAFAAWLSSGCPRCENQSV